VKVEGPEVIPAYGVALIPCLRGVRVCRLYHLRIGIAHCCGQCSSRCPSPPGIPS